MLNISGCMLGPKAGGYTSAARVAASAESTSRKWTACRLVSVQAGTAGGYIPAATGDAAAADTSAAATDNELTATIPQVGAPMEGAGMVAQPARTFESLEI